MKKRLFFKLAVHLMLVLFGLAGDAFAQGGDAKLTPNPKPTPSPKPAPKAAPKPAALAPATPALVYSQEVKDRFDQKSSGKLPGGGFYEEFILNARADDWLNFQLQGDDPDLAVQIVDKEKNEIPVARGGPNLFKINTQTGGLPAEGEYRLR
ncbi:MAG: hypothetical protein ACREEM_10325, partial [Blastocatellia bacterium]